MLKGFLVTQNPFIYCGPGETVAFEINVTNTGEVNFPQGTTLCLKSPIAGNDENITFEVCN